MKPLVFTLSLFALCHMATAQSPQAKSTAPDQRLKTWIAHNYATNKIDSSNYTYSNSRGSKWTENIASYIDQPAILATINVIPGYIESNDDESIYSLTIHCLESILKFMIKMDCPQKPIFLRWSVGH